MKAVMCKELTGPDALVVEEVAAPKVGAGDVCVAVHAAGLNFFDILMVRGKYQAIPDLPFTPGTEAAGEVIEVGAEVKSVKLGDRVMAGGFGGAFAEELVVPEEAAFVLPDGVDYATAAALRSVYGTSYYALRDRAHLKANEILLVHGAAGGVGLAAVELGKMMGARVIATVGSDEKKTIVEQYGADEVINYTRDDFRERVKVISTGVGADVIYDPVGGEVFEQSLRCINWDGRLLVIGFASGVIPKPPMNLPLLKSCQIVGVFYGAWTMREPKASRELTEELIDLTAKGRIKPHVSMKFPLDGVRDAMAALTERRSTGKVILIPR